MDFENYFSTKFSMLGDNPYHPDGRVKAFGYQQNHIFSDCYLNGSMTCVDCHNPHSNSYQDINRNPLKGRFDNGQCISCHASISENISAHTFHESNSTGSQCTSCHMPFQQHRAVGNEIRFARADHLHCRQTAGNPGRRCGCMQMAGACYSRWAHMPRWPVGACNRVLCR